MDLSSNRISGRNQNASPQKQQGNTGRAIAGQPSMRTSSLSDYGTSRHVSTLSEGEIIKGEVTDLRNTEIEVTLENNTHVTAKLEDGASLAIGDTAAFKVVSIEKGEITLKALPKTPLLQEMSTIQKALDEAGLPKNEKNISIVRELMKEGLSINRQGIQNAMKLIYRYPDISLSTLLQIEKHQLPFNYEQALMFEALKEGNLSLPKQLEGISEGLHELLKSQSPGISEFFTMIQLLSGNAYTESPEETDLQAGNSPHTSNSLNLPFYFSSPEQQLSFLDILSNFQDTGEPEESINQGTFTLTEAVHAIMDGMSHAMEIDENNRRLAMLEEDDLTPANDKNAYGDIPKEENELPLESENISEKKGLPFFKQFFSLFSQEAEPKSSFENTTDDLLVPSTLDLFDHPVIHHIMQSYEEQSLTERTLYYLLTPEELSSLSNTLKNVFPDSLSDSFISGIRYGELSVYELMKELGKQLKQAPFPLDGEHGFEIYNNPVIHKLFAKALFSSDFLTPRDFYSKENVGKNYVQINSTLNVLEHILKSEERMENPIAHNLLTNCREIKSQLSFLSDINNNLQYLQLPLCLKHQNTKGELYVYTKKQALREKGALSVLLHLDMENLGPLDITLQMESNRIQAVFNIKDNPQEKVTTKEILNSHLDVLKNALEEKGFLLNSRLQTKEEFTSFSSFMEEQQKGSTLKRYTFDIRA